MKFCAKCGTQMSDDSGFCPACGAAVGGNQNQNSEAIPTFTPPQQEVPVFSPPPEAVPTFTPPKQERPNGPCCHHHKMEPAVTRCARCGKYICQDCAEAYGVSSGDYAGQSLCYDCTEEMVSDNVRELTKNKNKIMFHFVLSIVGMVIGFIIGMSAGIESGDIGSGFVSGFVCACIGGVFLSAIKAFLSLTWDCIKIAFSGNFGWLTVLSIIWNIIVIVFKCIWLTISNTFYYIKYLRETSGFIASDSQALQEMKDYMEYTQVMSMNKGVDLETLMHEGSQLYNNSYAQSVATNGEAAADAHLRQCVTTIAENGEIIRSFAA